MRHTPTWNITEVRSQLEVARNFPSGENWEVLSKICADVTIGFTLTCMCLTNVAWAAISCVRVIFCNLGTKQAARELLGLTTGFVDFGSATLPSARDLDTFVLASSPTPINLLIMMMLRTRFINLARVAEISVPGSGVDGNAVGAIVGEASDGRPLASPELPPSSLPSWKRTRGLAGAVGPVLGSTITALDGMVGLLYGGMDSTLGELPALSGVWSKIPLIHLKGADARRTTPALQSRAVFDFSGAVTHPTVALSSLPETSSRISASHFLPLCRLNTMRSEANQADTAARPKELKAEKTVVIVEVT